jgi:hypothetical protein
LNVGVNPLSHEAARAIVDYLNSTFILLFQQNILRLQIAMDQIMVLLVLEGLQDLNCKSSDEVL